MFIVRPIHFHYKCITVTLKTNKSEGHIKIIILMIIRMMIAIIISSGSSSIVGVNVCSFIHSSIHSSIHLFMYLCMHACKNWCHKCNRTCYFEPALVHRQTLILTHYRSGFWMYVAAFVKELWWTDRRRRGVVLGEQEQRGQEFDW